MDKMTEEKSATSTTVAKADVSDKSEAVVARLPQGYDTKINIRIVPGRDIELNPKFLGCQPRQGASRRDAEAVALPEPVVEKLRVANKKVLEWLAQDAANAQLFMVHPVEALVKAGVELTRSEQKTLNRAHLAVSETSVIAPGVKVTDFSVSTYLKGRVGKNKPGTKTSGVRDEDCGCKPNGKE